MILFAPISIYFLLFDELFYYDTYSSRPNLVLVLEYVFGCNIDYWDESSEFYSWDTKCFDQDLF
jgi:hypothetical protein